MWRQRFAQRSTLVGAFLSLRAVLAAPLEVLTHSFAPPRLPTVRLSLRRSGQTLRFYTTDIPGICRPQALIHLDRLLFVREGLRSKGADSGGGGGGGCGTAFARGEAGLVPLFDASVSPRNIALVAVRRRV